MKKNRTIPFGYEMKNGEIQPNLIESKAVQTIFERYLQGASLADIAQRMTESGVPYHETSLIWNKNMVKRILENARYMGTDSFYPLISEETFASVNEKKLRKIQPVSAEIAVLKAMCVCAECGWLGKPKKQVEGDPESHVRLRRMRRQNQPHHRQV